MGLNAPKLKIVTKITIYSVIERSKDEESQKNHSTWSSSGVEMKNHSTKNYGTTAPRTYMN